MQQPILIATDLDRTALPNGPQPESPQASAYFRALAAHPQTILAFVSGRSKTLQQQAIEEYNLPLPDYAIGDVGTTIYVTHDNSWEPLQAWQETIAPDWNGKTQPELAALLDDIPELVLQEPEKQNTYKLSYYAPEDTDKHQLLPGIEKRLQDAGVNASLIWSIDEAEHTGLLDVLPKSATKLHAVAFLIRHCNVPKERVVFCGDSGNDLPALTSGLQAVLVANARDEVRQEAEDTLKAKDLEGTLYVAAGNFLGLNGNYSAGVVEGAAHYLPEVREYLESVEIS